MARLVYTLVAAFAFAPPTMVVAFAFARPWHLSSRSTVTITRSWWEGPGGSPDDGTARENSAVGRRTVRTRAKKSGDHEKRGQRPRQILIYIRL